MVGVERILGIPELASPKRVGVSRNCSGETATATHNSQDTLSLSPAARDAATIAGLIEKTKEQDGIDDKRVAEVRESLEKGTYKLQSVVLEIAARVAKYVSL
jgi:anti-sigma28 factor (negative regulator of flagellin synthesis)